MDKKVKILAILFLLTCISFLTLRFSRAYFSDTEKILGNSIQVGTWGMTISPTPTETPSPEAPTSTPTEIIAPTPTPTTTETPTQTPTPTLTPTNTPTLTTGHIVINEIFYQGDYSREWIEIYNAGSVAFDLSGWSITDNTQTDTLVTTSLLLQPGNFAVIVGTNNSGQPIASGAILIVLGNTAIGNGLAEDGDRLILKDNISNVVDQMNYGDDTAVWNPARAGVAVGYSLERSPVGKDTDTASDFVDQSSPSPGS